MFASPVINLRYLGAHWWAASSELVRYTNLQFLLMQVTTPLFPLRISLSLSIFTVSPILIYRDIFACACYVVTTTLGILSPASSSHHVYLCLLLDIGFSPWWYLMVSVLCLWLKCTCMCTRLSCLLCCLCDSHATSWGPIVESSNLRSLITNSNSVIVFVTFPILSVVQINLNRFSVVSLSISVITIHRLLLWLCFIL